MAHAGTYVDELQLWQHRCGSGDEYFGLHAGGVCHVLAPAEEPPLHGYRATMPLTCANYGEPLGGLGSPRTGFARHLSGATLPTSNADAELRGRIAAPT